MHRRLARALATLLVAIGASCAANDLQDYDDSRFKPGQVWRYHARQGEQDSTATVLKVETHSRLGVLVHVSIDGLRLMTPLGELTDAIRHMPVDRNALARSVTTKIRDGANTAPGRAGYAEWRHAFDAGKAGVYTTPLADCIETVEDTATHGTPGP